MFLCGLVVLLLIAYPSYGVISDGELPPDVVADNAYLEELAANAPISNEERKVVALLERIENKISTLNEEEKVEFVKKVANYKDKFALVLNKVEAIPGMYGLNVRLLREVLAIPSEEVEEIHIDIDETLEPEPRVEPPSVIDESRLMDNMIVAERKAAYPGSHEFALPFEVDEDVDEDNSEVEDGYDEEPKTIDDLYDAITTLSNLVLVQIIHAMNPADEEPSLPALPIFAPPQFALPPQPTYQSSYQMPSARSYQTQSQSIPNRRPLRPKPMKPMPRQQTPRFQPQPSPYNFEDLFANIPAHYDEVHLNLNYGNKKKRKRRQAEQGGQQATQQQITYDQWYQTVYLPYLNQYTAAMEEYYRQLEEYEMAVVQADIPTNPFGNPSLMNPYYSYSKKAYSQYLYDQGSNVDIVSTYGVEFQEYQKQLCEPTPPTATGNPCYIAPTGVLANTLTVGECGKWDATTSTCA